MTEDDFEKEDETILRYEFIAEHGELGKRVLEYFKGDISSAEIVLLGPDYKKCWYDSYAAFAKKELPYCCRVKDIWDSYYYLPSDYDRFIDYEGIGRLYAASNGNVAIEFTDDAGETEICFFICSR